MNVIIGKEDQKKHKKKHKKKRAFKPSFSCWSMSLSSK